MSAKEKQVRVSTLTDNIGKAGKSLAEIQLPVDKSGGASKLHENSEMLDISITANHLQHDDDWAIKQQDYQELSKAFSVHQKNFYDCAEKIVSKGATLSNRQEFEKATRQYYKALELLQQCQLNMANALLQHKRTEKSNFGNRVSFLELQFEVLDTGVTNFKNKIQDVAKKLADKQMKTPIKGETVNLENSIPVIAAHYKQAYDESYGVSGFWRWIKNIFQKSDRAKEIEFLNAVSTHVKCNELVRAQAVALVHNKILDSEMFGKGSQLGKLLGNLLEGQVLDKKGAHENLAQFLEANKDLKGMMPENLKEYFDENQKDYDSEIINTVKF